jgi:hypothetical protein
VGTTIEWWAALVSRQGRVLCFALFTPESGVDSAEADQVGSQRIRFCAYVKTAHYEGVRHRRTTPGAPFLPLSGLSVRPVLAQAQAAPAHPISTGWQE